MNNEKENINILSLKGLAEQIWKLEKKFDLINFEIESVKVWQYLRFRIFREIALKLELFEQFHTKKTGFFHLLKASPSLFFYSVFSNPLAGNYKKEFLIFNAGRKIIVDGKAIDIYTKYLVDEIKEGAYEIIEELYLNKHLTSELRNRKHQDYQMIRTFVLSRLSRFRFNQKQNEFIELVAQEIESAFGISIHLKSLFRLGYLEFKYNFSFYTKLLRKRQPRKIYMVCSYGYKMALVAAAKKLGIENIEIQHGTMNKYHLGYSYPNSSYVDYFPDKIYFFGPYWKDCVDLPLKKANKIIYGFPYFQNQKKQLKNITKRAKTILIISQGSIGNKLSEFLWKSREFLHNYEITYKLHPGEYDRWETDYPELVHLAKQKNVTIIDNNNVNLYELLAETEFVIGVYSTAVYEALSFNCKVLVVNLPGIEYLEDLIKMNIVKLVSRPEDISKHIENGEFAKFDSKLFFA